MSKAKSKDMRDAIKAFIHHVESLENAEDPEQNGFEAEYRLIQEAQIRNRRDNVFSMEAGKVENNLKKNRYKDILPYDDHRVTLSVVDGVQDSDYINASKLMGVKGSGGYIATQGPLSLTVSDLWRMIWEYNVEIVFMACRIVESGKIKCKQYWNDLDKSEEFEGITVFTEAEEKIMSDCVRRNFRVTRGEEVRHVIQFHYSGWPDHGIPDDAGHIRDMIGFVRQTRHNHQAPLLVHCSAGCGRTGAIIAIDYVWTLLEEGMFDGKFNLFDLICDFREQRMSIVQTTDQYALVNKVLKSLCEEWLKKMASHTYENVKVDQASDIDGDTSHTASKQGQRDAWHLAQHGQNAMSGSSNVPTVSKSSYSAVNGLQAAVYLLHPQRPQNLIGADVYRAGPKSPPADAGYDTLNKPGRISLPADAGYDTLNKSGPISPPADAGYDTLNKPGPKSPPADAGYDTLKKPGPISPPADVGYDTLNKPGPISPPADAGYDTLNKPGPKSPPADAGYDTLNKPGPISPPADAGYDTFSKLGPISPKSDTSVNKKAFKAPKPPAQFLKLQSQSDEPVYSTVNKTSSLKPVVECLSPLPRKMSSSDEKAVYNTITEASHGSTAYEVIDFPTGPSSRSLSSSSVEASRERLPSASTSPRQLNSRSLPGFRERLPRVRGPVPMPQAWNKV